MAAIGPALTAASPYMAGAGLGLAGLSFVQQSGAASMAAREGQLAAEMEDVAALQRETDRKLELARAVSTTRARASGAGIAVNVGSPLAIIEQQIEQEKIDTERDKFNAKIAAQSARYRGAAEAGQLRGQAGISLLKAGTDFVGTFKPKEKGTIK